MKHGKILCLIWMITALTMLATGCGREQNLVSDAEEVVSRVISFAEDIADPEPPVEEDMFPDSTPEPTEAPFVLATAEPVHETPAPTETVAAEPAVATAVTAGELRPGTYEGSDGSMLNVEEDGACTYNTTISGTINGEPMTGTVTFHGTVEEGDITFTKITYYGLDITALAAAAGYDDPSYWEIAAENIYNG